MTLFRQLALLVMFVFLMTAAILLAGNLQQNARLLQGQMQTTARDMATLLGMVIGHLPQADDPASLEVLFNAVFDSGYYSLVELIATDGRVIQSKGQQIQVDGVPQWFIDWLPLQPAEGSTPVMQGWQRLGRLRVVMHPGYAYRSLYLGLIETLQWSALLLAGSILLLWLLLRVLLRPLQRVREQADALAQNRFPPQQAVPRTAELKTVVEAMNRLSARMQLLFDEQQRQLERYQRQLYRDEASGLGNRRYLLEQLQQAGQEDSAVHGCLCVIRIDGLAELRRQQGYDWADRLWQTLSGLLNAPAATLRPEGLSRLGDEELAFLAEADEEACHERLQEVLQRLVEQTALAGEAVRICPVAAVIRLGEGDSSEWLATADYALARAQSRGCQAVVSDGDLPASLPRGRQAWRAWLDALLQQRRLLLAVQPVLDAQGEIDHRELLLRARDEQGRVLPAAAFMPMAAGLGLSAAIEQQAFALVRERLVKAEETPLAVNLGAASLQSAEARQALDGLIRQAREHGRLLCIELRHALLLRHPELGVELSRHVVEAGQRFGIDALDPSLPLDLLKQASVHYVKVHVAHLLMDSGDESAGFGPLKTMTDALGIELIAVGVEQAAQQQRLQSLGIRWMQGHALSPPAIDDRLDQPE